METRCLVYGHVNVIDEGEQILVTDSIHGVHFHKEDLDVETVVELVIGKDPTGWLTQEEAEKAAEVRTFLARTSNE